MKTKSDPRHLRRRHTIQELFAWQFSKDLESVGDYTRRVLEKQSEIDQLIQTASPNRSLDQINRIDLSILRLAIFEMIVEKDTPFKVIVDEAIELGKEFGSESSPSFINGALGTIWNQYNQNQS